MWIQRASRLFACVIAAAFSFAAAAGDLPRIFMTSVAGDGDLSTWPDAHGMAGIDGADEVCRTRAAAASIPHPEEYIALMSDSQSDAYCRLHGATGQRVGNNCNQSVVPTGAGPWYRMDDLASMDVVDNSMPIGTAGYMPRHILYDEFGQAFPSTPNAASLALTATFLPGTLINPGESCSDWTSSSHDNYASLGSAFRGFGGFASFGGYCDQPQHLICLAKGVHGPPLPRHAPPNSRIAFVTSAGGTGDLSSWPEAGGATSLQAADAICRTEAKSAGLARSESFKAWLSSSFGNARSRFAEDGPLYRPDGVRVIASLAGLASGVLDAPIELDATGAPTLYNEAWTGTRANGDASFACNDWTSSADQAGGITGLGSAAGGDWVEFDAASGCPNTGIHLYCIGDNDSLFLAGFE